MALPRATLLSENLRLISSSEYLWPKRSSLIVEKALEKGASCLFNRSIEERGFVCDVHCASWTLDRLVEAGSPALDVDLKLSSVKDCLSEATSSASSLTLPVSFSCFSLSSTCCTARKFGPSSLDTGLSVSLSLFN